jgi:hypothetical protein
MHRLPPCDSPRRRRRRRRRSRRRRRRRQGNALVALGKFLCRPFASSFSKAFGVGTWSE